MKIAEVFGLSNAIGQLLQEKLNTELIFKLHKVLKKLEPEIKSTQETLEKVRNDNEGADNLEVIVHHAEQKLLQDDSELTLEPTINKDELPEEMTGIVLIGLLPIITEEENK